MAVSTELISKLRDMTQCPVCLEQLKEPRMLPCQHSFCLECLEGILDTGHTIRCPCCNKYTPVYHGVWELPVDFRANSLLETLTEHEKAKAAREAREAGAATVPAAEEAVLGAEATVLQDAFQLMSLDKRCPVCEEIPTVFKNLSCGHHLCENCVQFLMPVGGDTLHCPTCSRQTRLVATSNTGTRSPSLQSQGDEHCPVCEEIPTVSKNLSCGHRLCGSCVQFLMPIGGDTLHCPTCSCQTRLVMASNTGMHPRDEQWGETMHGGPMMGPRPHGPPPGMPPRGYGSMQRGPPGPPHGRGPSGPPGHPRVCKYFMKGMCWFDENCRYLHPGITEPWV